LAAFVSGEINVCVRGWHPKASFGMLGFRQWASGRRHGAKLAGRGQVAKAVGYRTEKGRIGFFADRVSPRGEWTPCVTSVHWRASLKRL
jgi:hypothetical protein